MHISKSPPISGTLISMSVVEAYKVMVQAPITLRDIVWRYCEMGNWIPGMMPLTSQLTAILRVRIGTDRTHWHERACIAQSIITDEILQKVKNDAVESIYSQLTKELKDLLSQYNYVAIPDTIPEVNEALEIVQEAMRVTHMKEELKLTGEVEHETAKVNEEWEDYRKELTASAIKKLFGTLRERR